MHDIVVVIAYPRSDEADLRDRSMIHLQNEFDSRDKKLSDWMVVTTEKVMSVMTKKLYCS